MEPSRFTEHRVPVRGGSLYVRDYAGTGPAFVPMHGFPDNLHIYDEVIPHLIAAGRRVVTFDFLGFGASDKPGHGYSFAQQLADLEAVVADRGLDRIVPVAHDSSGPAAVNYTLAHPDRVDMLAILNSAYDEPARIVWPELVELFATKGLARLALAVGSAPEQFKWVLEWQQRQFHDSLPEHLRANFDAVTGRLIADNFVHAESGPAFAQLASQFHEELARNSLRLTELRTLDVPVKVIWGEFDPYITTAIGRDRASRFKTATFLPLPGGHWVQSDVPGQVAAALLA